MATKMYVTVITPFKGEFEFVARKLGERIKKDGFEPVFEHIEWWGGDTKTMTHFGMLVVGNLPYDLAEKLKRAGKRYIYFAVDRTPDLMATDLSPEEIEKVGYKLYEVREMHLNPVEGGCHVC